MVRRRTAAECKLPSVHGVGTWRSRATSHGRADWPLGELGKLVVRCWMGLLVIAMAGPGYDGPPSVKSRLSHSSENAVCGHGDLRAAIRNDCGAGEKGGGLCSLLALHLALLKLHVMPACYPPVQLTMQK